MHVCQVASVMSDSLQLYGLYPTRLLCPWVFCRQEYWSGLTCLPPGDLPNPGTEPTSLESLVTNTGFFATDTAWEAHRR